MNNTIIKTVQSICDEAIQQVDIVANAGHTEDDVSLLKANILRLAIMADPEKIWEEKILEERR